MLAERSRIAAEMNALKQRLPLLAVAINRLAAARDFMGQQSATNMAAADRYVDDVCCFLFPLQHDGFHFLSAAFMHVYHADQLAVTHGRNSCLVPNLAYFRR